MTSHGFGGVRVSSEITDEEIAKIAEQISKDVRGIIRAHFIKPHIVEGYVFEGLNYNVMFEFAHLKDLGMTPEELLNEISKIAEANGKHVHETAFWIIQHSFQKGKRKEKKDK